MYNILTSIQIQPLDLKAAEAAAKYIDTLTKPQGSLGRLEELAINLAGITQETFPTVTPPGVLVFAADHGVVEEGVSAFPQSVTAQMALNFLAGGAAINVFSKQIGAQFQLVDIGIASSVQHSELSCQKVRMGTRNFCKEHAMTRNEVEQAIEIGINEATNLIKKGIKCLIVGEMGIGNTTSSTALLAALTSHKVDDLVGSGTGINSQQLKHKIKKIEQALENRQYDVRDPIAILSAFGGLEIAGMVGAMLAAASHRIPIIVDGFICTTAAVFAVQMNELASNYMFASHQSVEPGHRFALSILKKEPLLNLQMRLGEGSGAAIAFPLLHSACLMITEMATFADAGVANKE